MKTVEEIDCAIAEAEFIRGKHDGVHAMHGYLCVLRLCRDLAEAGEWSSVVNVAFDETIENARVVGRTGFPVRPRHAIYEPRRSRWDIGD